MFEKEIIELSELTEIEKFKNLTDKEKEKFAVLFFHFKKSDYIKNYQLMKNFEKETNIYVNWFDCEKLFSEFSRIHRMLHFKSMFLNVNFESEIKDTIKEYILNQFFRTGNFYQIKGDTINVQ